MIAVTVQNQYQTFCFAEPCTYLSGLAIRDVPLRCITLFIVTVRCLKPPSKLDAAEAGVFPFNGMTEETGLISEHHSHADLQILLARSGREPHQILIHEIWAAHQYCAVTCVCGAIMKAWPPDEALEAFERHYRAFKASQKRWTTN